MNEKNTKSLCNKFPDLLGLYFPFQCDDGWYGILDECFTELSDYINKLPYGDDIKKQFVAAQIKEKFASLRIYIEFPVNKNMEETIYFNDIYEIINKYESKSTEVCEYCGGPGKIGSITKWYIKCFCENCITVKEIIE